jgi:hypothetical protein
MESSLCPWEEFASMFLTSARNAPPMVLALAVWTVAVWGPAQDAVAAEPTVTTPNASAKGDTTEVMGLKATAVKLRANVLGCLCWADEKGTAFWALDPVGIVRRITFPDLEVTHAIELGKTCLWLSPSAEGLVVSVAEGKEVWLLDPTTFKVKQKVAVPSLLRAASALSLSTAFAIGGKDLYEVDLKKGTAGPYSGPRPKLAGFKDPVVSPDGKYLFVAGTHEEMHRFGIKDGKAKYEQSSPRIAQGRVDIGIQVSPDSRFVTLPCYAGNYTAGKYGNIFVYPVENIERAEVTLEFGGPSGMAISADPASGKFYSQGLLVFDKGGKRENEYKLGAGEIKQMLVHPLGGKLVLLGTSKFLVVEMPQK